ncbi:hypothetical protein [Cytobacillus oceanisediminis]|jgi:hypothetical protein|uniref:Pilus assembly protein Flp/PilA n=1 Tax=Cytobacillus oceanisediminis TaxID=665099 RepID=A0A562J5Y3_9BACI|nr:hypothetical protein [Cytobacillus oceanisediminis]TWH78588.1 hypothetical protein IQ19_05222 [Cytobacillus oceanisediminis]
MKKVSIKLYQRITSALNNERGAQTLEWVAVGAVVVTIAALLGSAFDGNGIKGIVDSILDKIADTL